jgi:serine/threonine protein kinase
MQNNTLEFMKEYDMMQSIDHEHIVRLYGVVLDNSQIMLITELAPLRHTHRSSLVFNWNFLPRIQDPSVAQICFRILPSSCKYRSLKVDYIFLLI